MSADAATTTVFVHDSATSSAYHLISFRPQWRYVSSAGKISRGDNGQPASGRVEPITTKAAVRLQNRKPDFIQIRKTLKSQQEEYQPENYEAISYVLGLIRLFRNVACKIGSTRAVKLPGSYLLAALSHNGRMPLRGFNANVSASAALGSVL